MIADGLNLMIYGMGTVFVFLTLLVLITMAMSSLVLKFSPEEPQPSATLGQQSSQLSAQDPKLVAIIQAAISAHKKR